RIDRMRRRYQTGDVFISVERAKHYTESWRDTEGKGVALPVRVALAMKNVYEKMTHYVDADDRIAGYWTERFLGFPIDIERGQFNSVFEAELTMPRLLRFRAKSLGKGLAYMVRKGVLREFLRNQRLIRANGMRALNMELKTMSRREVNPYQITTPDRKVLIRELLPYWKGRAIADCLEAELQQSGLYSKDMYDFVIAVPGNTSRQVMMISPAASIATIQGHVIPNFDSVLEKGLLRMAAEVDARRLDAPPETREFFEAVSCALEGVIVFARRLADAVAVAAARAESAEQRAEMESMLAICRRCPLHAPATFREAVQSLWTVKTAVELAYPVNLHCFGRLDQQLYPFYAADLAAGRITREAATELVEELLLKIMSLNIRPESNILGNFYHRYLGSSPVTLGGVRPDGADATNELTYIFLDAAHRSKAITNISVRINPGTPNSLLERVAEYLQEGTSSFSLFNDAVNIEAMTRRGFSEEDARDYAVMGCVETTCPGKTGGMSASALQLSKVLDMTLRNGDMRTIAGTVRGEGLRTGDPSSFESFDELVEAFLKQARHLIARIVDASNLRDRLYAEWLPAPMISAFIDGCLDSGRDVTAGGARYDLAGISMINALANVFDSLLVIKKLVFDERRFGLREFLSAMDDNFASRQDVLHAVRQVKGKWGNGDSDTDAMARRIAGELFAETYRHTNFRGGPFVVYIISMITHTIDGRLSVASPDGRKAGMPYAASGNPYNVEHCGVTAALRSVAALPFEDVMGCAVNMKFHPNAIGKGPVGRAKWAALLRTYFQMGGPQLQPTVAGAETLRAAQRDPDQYRDLIIKVGGYSTYFVDLGKEIQEEIIARTEHAAS
ncbi:MAG TPA: pyruvate formate lyase family protein, partial [Candidatus Hydrogenedentes bacterium]|nr:pyruvate formate lyase family protein [Candidatus Hydrogenedentota bacterium]